MESLLILWAPLAFGTLWGIWCVLRDRGMWFGLGLSPVVSATLICIAMVVRGTLSGEAPANPNNPYPLLLQWLACTFLFASGIFLFGAVPALLGTVVVYSLRLGVICLRGILESEKERTSLMPLPSPAWHPIVDHKGLPESSAVTPLIPSQRAAGEHSPMADAFDPVKSLGEIPKSHACRCRFHAEADRSVISTIQLGVLFVMAFWSGPSRQGIAQLKQVLEALDPDGRLELVVVDTDGCPDLYETPEFAGQLMGWGEVGWVRDGRVVFTSGMGYHPECFEPFTRELMKKASDAGPNAAVHDGA